MRLHRKVKAQLAVFVAVSIVAGILMIFGYVRVPALLGLGHYTVTVQLPQSSGLYKNGNVTYRGTEVGRIEAVSEGTRTADLGGHAGTREFTDEVIRRTRTKLEVWSSI